jgi:hypothetical protein
LIGRPVSGITGSAGIVVDVEPDADEVVVESAVEDELVEPDSVFAGLVTAAAVVADDESLPLLHAASASASAVTMNVVVGFVYFTVSLSSADALFERGVCPNMCSRRCRR